MAQTNFEELFDDIMTYAEQKIDRPETFDTTRDLRRFIQRSDDKGKINSNVMNQILQTDNALELVEQKPVEVDIVEFREKLTKTQFDSVIKEVRRRPRTRVKDESVTAKIVFGVNVDTFKRWQKNPAKIDLRGIDTKTHSLITKYLEVKREHWQSRGFDVKNYKDTIFWIERQDKRGRKYYMNVANGQRIGRTIIDASK